MFEVEISSHASCVAAQAPTAPGASAGTAQQNAFPIQCLPERFQEFVAACANAHRVQVALPACCALGAVSFALGKGLAVASGPNRLTFGNLYILISARSGAAKSAVARDICGPLFDFENALVVDWKSHEISRSAEREILERKIKRLGVLVADDSDRIRRESARHKLEDALDAQAANTRRRAPPRICVEDATPAGLAAALDHNDGVLASISTEAGAIFDGLVRRSGKPDRALETLLLKSYSVEFLRVDRLSRPPILLNAPCLAALWLAQPQKVDDLYRVRALAEGGLLPRIMPATINIEQCPEQSPPKPDLAKWWKNLLVQLLENFYQSLDTATVSFTTDALKTLTEHERNLFERRRAAPEELEPFIARWGEWCWRLCNVLHALKWQEEAVLYPVDHGTATAAINLGNWFASEQMKLLRRGDVSATRSLREQVLSLLNHKPDGIIAADVYRKRIVASAQDAHRLLQQMESERLIRGENSSPAHGGHATRRFKVAT